MNTAVPIVTALIALYRRYSVYLYQTPSNDAAHCANENWNSGSIDTRSSCRRCVIGANRTYATQLRFANSFNVVLLIGSANLLEATASVLHQSGISVDAAPHEV